jgi:hypothetical protein
MAALTDFTILDITPEFNSGSEVVTVKSVVPGVRSGIALIPNTTPVGLSIYNTDNITNYGFADLLIHPGLPDTLLISSRAVGTGIKPTKIKSLLKIELSADPVNDLDAATKQYVDNKLSGTVGVKVAPTITTALPTANYVTIEDGEYAVYDTADYTGVLSIITPVVTEINIATDGVPYYIYAEYNGSDGVVAATTDEHSCHVGTRAIIVKVIRTGTTFHVVSNDRLANGLPEKLHLMTSSVLGYNVESGLELSVVGGASRQVICDSGTVWNGAVETHLDAIDTSGADQYLSVTWNGSAWAFAPATSLNNTQYNSPAGVQSLTGSNYAVNWIYRGVEEQKHLYVLLGTTNDKLDVTEAANPPIPPSWITDHSVLLGRVMFQRNNNTPIIETTSDLGHTFVGAIRHNDTTGRQGGTTDEYYHLTAAEYAGTGTGVFVRTTDPTFANHVTITGELRGPASFVIDPSAVGDNTGTVVIKGNLQVDGTTTTVNSTTMTVDDLIITLGGDAAPVADDNKDRGVEFRWYDTAARTGFFGFDDSTGYFTFIPQATNTSEVFSGTMGDMQATNFRGNLVGGTISATGASSFAAGTVSLPSIYFSTNTTSGLYQIGANNIGVAISAAKVLDIASTGLTVTGDTTTSGKLNAGKFHYAVLQRGQSSEFTAGVKIKTNIPGGSGFWNDNVATIWIEAYNYRVAKTMNLCISWYGYSAGNTFLNQTASSYGGIAPAITLSIEAGKVVINLAINSGGATDYYYSPYTIRAYDATNADSAYTGWTIVDEAVTGTQSVSVTYTNRFGNATIDGTLTTAAINTSGALSITNTTDTTSSATGALLVSGGVGIAKRITLGSATAHTQSNAFGQGDISIDKDVYSSIGIFSHDATDGNFPAIVLGRSGGTKASQVVVTSSQTLGGMLFTGWDGANATYRTAASIRVFADGTVSSGIVPGALSFRTANASGTETERIRISSGGATTITGTLNVTSDTTLTRLYAGGGNTNWPTTTIGSSAGRHILNGSTYPMLVLWNEEAASIAEKSAIYIGGKTGAGATTFGGGRVISGLLSASTSQGYVDLQASNNVGFFATPAIRISGKGSAVQSAVLIGTTTDDGSNLLQVAGNTAIAGVISNTLADNNWHYRGIAASGEVQLSGWVTGQGGPAIRAVNLGGGAYTPLNVDGSFVYLRSSGTTIGTVSSTGIAVTGDFTVSGNLTVNGTTTTINATTITVDDKNIELGSVAVPTDVLADGGGITLKGSTDKTFNWVDATDAWTSSEHLNLLTGKSYYINGVSVLSATALGSAVVASSLTSVGTVTSGIWSASFGAVSGANLTNLTAANLTGTIPSAVLGNSTVYIGTTAIALNRTTASQALTGITSIDGSAATWTTSRTLAGNSVNGSANVAFSNKFIVQGTTDAGLSGAQFLGALGTGLVKNTTTTGVLSIAAAATDYVAPSAYASANGLTMNTARLIGRTTASSGAAEEISVAGNLTLSGGVLTGTAASTVTITDDTTTNATMYPVWVTAASGTPTTKVSSTKLTFNPAVGLIVDGKVSIGTAAVDMKVNIAGPRYTSGGFQSVMYINSTDAFAADVGAGIALGGVYTGSTQTGFAEIVGTKANVTDGNYEGRMQLKTRTHAGSMEERMRLGVNSGVSFAAIPATAKLFLDGVPGTGDTYLVESSANVLDIYAGAAKALSLTATTITNQGIIKFQPTGGSVSAITLNTLTDGTLSFEGTAGQLFSIGNSLTGTIFTVNDVSGMPSIEVLDTGLVKLAEYNGSVQIGSSTVASNTVNYGYMTIGPTAGVTGAIHRPYTAAATNAAIYNAGVTPGASNYALLHNATTTVLNATTNTYLNVNNNAVLTAASTGITISGTLTASIVDAGVGTITEAARFSRSGATPTATDRGVGIAFGDADNFTLVGGVAGIRTGSDGNYNGDLILYASSSGGAPTTTLGGLTERLRVVGTAGVSVTGALSATGNIISGTYGTPSTGTGVRLGSAGTIYGQVNAVDQWSIDASGNASFFGNITNTNATASRIITAGTTLTTGNAAVTARSGTDPTIQMVQFGATAAGTTFGISNNNLATIYTTTYATTHPTALAIGTISSTPLVFGTSGAERMRVLSSGEFGIGTTAPASRLQVGDTTVSVLNQIILGKYETSSENNLPRIQTKSIMSAAASCDLALGATSTSGGILFYTGNNTTLGSGSNTLKMSISSSGDVAAYGAKVEVGSAYHLSLSRSTSNAAGDGFVWHNAEYSSGYITASLLGAWKSTHGSFGSRGIGYSYLNSTTGIHFYADNVASTAGATFTPTERMVISNAGNVSIGATATAATYAANAVSVLGVEKSQVWTAISAKSYSATASAGGVLVLGHSKSATIGTQTQTASGDTLGAVSFEGVNSSSAVMAGAYIVSKQDAAVGATYIPGSLEFSTGTAAAAPTVKLTINSTGNIGMGVNTPFAAGTPTFTLSGANPYLELNANAGSHTQIRLYSIGVYKGGLLKQTTDDIALTSVAGKSVQISVDGASTVAANFAATTGYLSIGYTTSAARTNIHIAKASNTLAALKSTVANAAICITSPYTAGADFAPGIVWSSEDNSATLPKAGIFTNFTSIGSYLRFGTSNNYATGITNDALIIDPSGNSIFGGSYISVGTGTIGKIRVKQTADDYSSGITLQRASTLDTWQIVQGSDNKFYLGYATAASGADASGDFTNEMVIDTAGNVTFTGSVTATSVTAPTAMGTLYTGVDTGAAGTCNIDGPACPLTLGGIYEVFISVNCNNVGSSSYREMITGYITINTGWNGSAVANYIDYMQLSPSIPVTGLGAAMSVAVTTWNGTAEATTYLTTASPIPNIRVKVTGWVGTASSGTCRIARKM